MVGAILGSTEGWLEGDEVGFEYGCALGSLVGLYDGID